MLEVLPEQRKRLRCTLGHHLDGPVGQVAHPAGKAQRPPVPLHEDPETDALHAASHSPRLTGDVGTPALKLVLHCLVFLPCPILEDSAAGCNGRGSVSVYALAMSVGFCVLLRPYATGRAAAPCRRCSGALSTVW